MCMVSNPEHIQQLAVIIQLDMIEMGTLMHINIHNNLNATQNIHHDLLITAHPSGVSRFVPISTTCATQQQ